MDLEALKPNTDSLEQAIKQVSLTLHKDYLAMLDDEKLVSIKKAPSSMLERELAKNSRFFKINKLTYNKDEDILEKLATVFSADYYYGGTLALLIQSNKGDISYYLGNINKESKQDPDANGKLIKSTFEGNFPGSELEKATNPEVRKLFGTIFDGRERYSISAISGIAADKMEDESENEKFVQGMEKLLDATKK